tara:strand:+ start:157 stop:303 length:147 start_codon:yes stop_codon:yes gene_type:complete
MRWHWMMIIKRPEVIRYQEGIAVKSVLKVMTLKMLGEERVLKNHQKRN